MRHGTDAMCQFREQGEGDHNPIGTTMTSATSWHFSLRRLESSRRLDFS
jgi:hypothetical protein